MDRRPRIGISSCLLGEEVRYDGGHQCDLFLVQTLGAFVEWVPVCPELEVGMGVPREPVRLVRAGGRLRMVGERSRRDWTTAMQRYARRRLAQLGALDLAGYVLKSKSPSCGMERVKVYGGGGAPSRNGRGLFAEALMAAWPLLPVEEEGRLNDPALREHFIERVFAYARWRAVASGRPSLRALVAFHATHKLLIMAHSEVAMRRLGRLVAGAKSRAWRSAVEEYGRHFMAALGMPATRRAHANVLQHMAGHFSERLSADERQELRQVIREYHRGLVPLAAPLTLIGHYVRRFRVVYLQEQVYLRPHPHELMLRNHV